MIRLLLIRYKNLILTVTAQSNAFVPQTSRLARYEVLLNLNLIAVALAKLVQRFLTKPYVCSSDPVHIDGFFCRNCFSSNRLRRSWPQRKATSSKPSLGETPDIIQFSTHDLQFKLPNCNCYQHFSPNGFGPNGQKIKNCVFEWSMVNQLK